MVDHASGDLLTRCVESIRREGASEIVVVDTLPLGEPAVPGATAEPGATAVPGAQAVPAEAVPAEAGVDGPGRLEPVVIRCGVNLGYGRAANRGIAATSAELVLVSNPDVVLHEGALAQLVSTAESDPALGIVGPRILDPTGKRYPSARSFPSLVDAAGHGLLGLVSPNNRFTRRYRLPEPNASGGEQGSVQAARAQPVDWVSGACFLARRQLLEELGGFDEAYFMYAEDVDLCWRAHLSGWGVGYVPGAVVTHVQGVSTSRRPYRMLAAHHRSLLRFAWRTLGGWRKAYIVAVGPAVGVRMLVAWADHAWRGRSRRDRTNSAPGPY